MPDDTALPDDIEDLMKAFGVDPAKSPTPTPTPTPETPSLPGAPAGKTPSGAQEEVDKMLEDLQSKGGPPPAGEKPKFETMAPQTAGGGEASLDLLRDVSLQVRVEVGRTRMYVQDILKLGSGSVVELDRLTGDPLDVYVNDRLVARGEVLVINEAFAIRITEVLNPAKVKERQR